MNAFSLSGILIAATAFSLGIIVLVRSHNIQLSRLWFLFSIATTFWGLGVFCVGLNPGHDLSYLAWRLTYALGVIWISPVFYHFTSLFLRLDAKRSVRINYAIAGIWVCFVPTTFFFEKIEFLFGEFFYIRGGMTYHWFMVWWTGLVIYSHINLLRAMKLASPDKRNQIKYFFLATALGYTGGFQTYFPKIGIDYYPWGSFLVPLYPAIMAYAVLKYNLMDVSIFIRRAVAFVGIYGTLILGSVPLLLFLHGRIPSPVEILIISAVLSFGPFLYAAFVRRSYWLHGHVTTGLTHELKSPLSAIQSAVSILEERARSKSDGGENALEYIAMIQSNTDRLDSFIRDLLDVAKIQDQNISLDKTTCDLVQLTRDIVSTSSPHLQKKGLEIQWRTPPSVRIHADPQKIQQVISNVLSNAIKFSDQGTISIEIKEARHEIQFSVKDEGCGISNADLGRIFDRFFQSKAGLKGSGLGLAIAKAWVEAHGGKIWAESEGEGRGTTVKFTLPI